VQLCGELLLRLELRPPGCTMRFGRGPFGEGEQAPLKPRGLSANYPPTLSAVERVGSVIGGRGCGGEVQGQNCEVIWGHMMVVVCEQVACMRTGGLFMPTLPSS
jgi:hypothetical protein